MPLTAAESKLLVDRPVVKIEAVARGEASEPRRPATPDFPRCGENLIQASESGPGTLL